MSTSSPRQRRSSRILPLDLLSPHKNRNHSPGIQTETAMPQNAENRRNLARVRRHRNKRILLTRLIGEKHLTQRPGAPRILCSGRLGGNAVPELVLFAEAGFDSPGWEEGVDVGSVVAVIAGVDADSFAE